ncbi:DUF1631 domain-containing protein [Oceanicoccus sagamiensis]|uniref:Thymidine phosphorylase n=1 Tax=Oceanicoccus sagamiensis TaxID=716816 RepID=A0A1X9N723_9GAMM|nr:DUF1631 domain-containing protein [Oceanicoccus sagamiensis]ARN73021.1 hypothetical protein BST96_02205 [Oceanicoccus sagamiensis]
MADNTTKVVQLNSHPGHSAEEGADNVLFARLPAPFTDTKDRGKQSLQPLLQALFDNIDDALFELADRAEHNAEQNMYFESMRELRIKRRGMELCFGKEIDNAFSLLLTAVEAIPTLEATEQVSIDNLSLVADDELEELVAADNMVAKAERECSLGIKQLTTRLDTLIEGQSVTIKNNPFGPAVICQSFIEVCKTLDLDIKAKLVLFKLFDRYVMAQLQQVHEQCNSVLIEGGILANLGGDKRTAEQSVGSETAHAKNPSAAEPPNSDVFADLQNLLHGLPQPSASAGSGLVAPGQAPQIPRDTLMQLLQAVQKSLTPQMAQQQQQAMQGVGPQQLDIQQTLSSLLIAKMPEKPMSIGQVDDDAINLVAMLFQFILDDRNLAAPMKALISRLQIPIIKVSMLDKSFFSKGGHPARKLLNEIANASLGWVPNGNIERDPLYKKVSAVVEKIQQEYTSDSALFQDVLADFIVFLEMDKRRIQLIEQRTINAEDGKAKSELARNTVQNALNERVAGKSLPKVVVTLLEQAWSNVLFLICLKDGEDDSNWHEALQVVDDLLWSVEPMENTAARQQLLTMVPQLLKNLRAGLTKIAYNPFDMNQLFTDLEAIHLSQLKELNTVKLEVTEQESKVRAKEVIARQTKAIEKTLDQILEERDGGSISLEALDAELDEQLAGFDALGDLVAKSVDDTAEAADTAVEEQEHPVVKDDKLARHVVEKLVVNGASDTDSEEVIDISSDDPCLVVVDNMAMGNWVELHQDDNKKFRCRLAAIIRSTGKYIFVNRSGMKVAEYDRMSLAQAIKERKIGMLDEGLLFDRALESVIGNLRNANKTGS